MIVGIFVTVAVFAPFIAPEDPRVEQNLAAPARLLLPGPLGRASASASTQLGRDLFSRVVYGARYSLLIGVVSVAVGLSIGLLIGAIAGYFGGWIDSVLMRLMDIMLAIPGLLLAIGIVAALGPGPVADHDRGRRDPDPDLRPPLTRLDPRDPGGRLRARGALGRRQGAA